LFHTGQLDYEGTSRYLEEGQHPHVIEDYSIYNPESLYLYGGSSVYSCYLNLKEKVGDKLGAEIEEAYKNIPATSDLDATWWPTQITNLSVVPILSSPAILALRNAFIRHLREGMASLIQTNRSYINSSLSNVPNIETVVIDVVVPELEPNKVAGVYTINGNLVFHFPEGDQTVELFDVSIHDGANSQTYIPRLGILSGKEKNFAYVPDSEITLLTITSPDTRESVIVPVPPVQRLVEQQMMLISNLKEKIKFSTNIEKVEKVEKLEKAVLRLKFLQFLVKIYLAIPEKFGFKRTFDVTIRFKSIDSKITKFLTTTGGGRRRKTRKYQKKRSKVPRTRHNR